jgi:hypothetical protein
MRMNDARLIGLRVNNLGKRWRIEMRTSMISGSGSVALHIGPGE